jgi:hypothetical protein
MGVLTDLVRRDDVRLLTVTGPAGVGKTRLSQSVAAALADDFLDGVYFVSLAPLQDPELVLPTIGQAVGARHAHLADFLAAKRVLLVSTISSTCFSGPRVAVARGVPRRRCSPPAVSRRLCVNTSCRCRCAARRPKSAALLARNDRRLFVEQRRPPTGVLPGDGTPSRGTNLSSGRAAAYSRVGAPERLLPPAVLAEAGASPGCAWHGA